MFNPSFFSRLFIFISITIGTNSCQQLSSFDDKLDISRNFLCCGEVNNSLILKKVSLIRKKSIHIQLCEINTDFLDRIILVNKDEINKKFEIIWDLKVNVKDSSLEIDINAIDQKKFSGEFNKLKQLKQGDYRLILISDQHCGELKFRIRNDDNIKMEHFCISEKCLTP